MSKPQAKVVIRKVVKKHGHAHHGGSWKVAYADFVTAMMAFFMVMWILGMSPEARASIQNYFSNPVGVDGGYSGGPNPLGKGGMSSSDGMGRVKLISRVQERAALSAAGQRIEARLRSADGLREIAAQVEVVMTEQGLRIELVEHGRGETFFAFGDATLKPAAARALGVIASELETTGQPVVLEGHTDAAPFGRAGYTNWELSADRANAARRALESGGVGRDQVVEVRGYADRRMRVPDAPLSAENRRISILLPFTTPLALPPRRGRRGPRRTRCPRAARHPRRTDGGVAPNLENRTTDAPAGAMLRSACCVLSHTLKSLVCIIIHKLKSLLTVSLSPMAFVYYLAHKAC